MREASLLDLFRMEAESQTQALDAGLLVLEREPAHAGQLEACMRAAHSIKGAARIVGIEPGVQVAHEMENLFAAAQQAALQIKATHIDALLRGSDLLLRIGRGSEPGIDSQVALWMTEMSALRHAAPAAGASAAAPTQAPPPTQALPPAAAPEALPAEAADRVLRVSAAHLNELLDISGKSLVAYQGSKALSEGMLLLKHQHALARRALDLMHDAELVAGLRSPELAGARELLAACQQTLMLQLGKLEDFTWAGTKRSQLLYETALASRMRPLGDVLNGRARMVRDLARKLGKQARLEVQGETTLVDREVLERLDAPLMHLLRNAVDHGIELPEQRLRHGKAAEGNLLLRARHRAGMLLIELSDDGRGVDLEGLRARIVRRQLSPPELAACLSEQELLEFLFLPGFSTREQVGEISGRGIGLDVVQHDLRQLHGNVRVTQKNGLGTCFHLEMPLTRSVVRSLLVEIAGQVYAFPLAQIVRMRRLPADRIVQLEGRQHFWCEDQQVILISAAQLLGMDQPRMPVDELGIAVVLVRERNVLYGLVVERFIGERNLVVMQMDARLGKIRDVAAAALLDDESPVLILDVEDLLHAIAKLLDGGAVARVQHADAEGVQRQRRKRVLVVDDSLTVRELERKLLAARGYEVAVAVDGVDGWNALRAEHFDLLITDVDMPRMDGIELTSRVRADAHLQALPVMVVSYKDREEDRRRGLDAGADNYLTKASFQDDALLDAVLALIGEPQC